MPGAARACIPAAGRGPCPFARRRGWGVGGLWVWSACGHFEGGCLSAPWADGRPENSSASLPARGRALGKAPNQQTSHRREGLGGVYGRGGAFSCYWLVPRPL